MVFFFSLPSFNSFKGYIHFGIVSVCYTRVIKSDKLISYAEVVLFALSKRKKKTDRNTENTKTIRVGGRLAANGADMQIPISFFSAYLGSSNRVLQASFEALSKSWEDGSSVSQ